MPRVAVRDELAVPLDPVLVREARASDIAAARPDPEDLVEVGGAVVAEADLRRQRLEAALANRLVSAGVRREVCDAGNLEPDDEGPVVGDALRVRLREADAYVR